ncbi:MAG: carbohydrate ABC transporter permease, partial [Candidatus Bathyarchaeia archaeon]
MARPSKYLVYIALILVAFYSLGPIYYIFIVSISWPKDVIRIPSPLIPNDPTIANYMRIFGY